MKEKRYIIKTVDGNRYETDVKPVRVTLHDTNWMTFPTNDGVGRVFVSIANIVCSIVEDVEDD